MTKHRDDTTDRRTPDVIRAAWINVLASALRLVAAVVSLFDR
ncbi:hypothetical protein Deipr_2404 (plasmid) [Deinococcus proteolyticus MRP]|uniref:Uncharacterized protein n=1 Tax=Deinococcus proteolyticus (strain ATCC 35074 / DSM 20540 / JCM 6276 / NBRC 101906 / NCIMB 13154 / VKM Ac-1939 / CCM 2703 / MRP) TaxID=693977 RepID=F0RQG9_DEIPM|nr:hypothetical protein [Deinococcus proteolyticus]ADY27528.1 hypothetical protein Deipr_2404 [Deinococcus proteolyticus MRP]